MGIKIRILIFIAVISFGAFFQERSHGFDVVPEPQEIVYKSPVFDVTLNNQWVIAYDTISPPPSGYPAGKNPYEFCARKLKENLSRLGIDLKIADIQSAASRHKRIILGNPLQNEILKRVCGDYGIKMDGLPYSIDDSRYGEAYILEVLKHKDGEEDIIIAARGPAGVYYGLASLLEMITANGSIKALGLQDYPDMKWRGVYLHFKHFTCGRLVDADRKLTGAIVNCISEEVEKYALLKVNTIVFRGHLFHLMDRDNQTLLQELFDRCRERFITPIPSIESKLENMPDYTDPFNAVADSPVDIEGTWIRDEKFFFDASGVAKPEIPFESSIANGSFEIDGNKDKYPDSWHTNIQQPGRGWKWISASDAGESPSSIHGGKHSVKFIPAKQGAAASDIVPYTEEHEKLIEVLPNSYYELGFWSKGRAPSKSLLRVSVLQFDDAGRKIKKRVHFRRDLVLANDWQKNWIPIFTDAQCRKLKIALQPVTDRGPGGAIYIDDVELFRMNGGLLNVLRTGDTDINITHAKKGTLFEAGVDYNVEDVPLHFSPAEQLDRLKRIRIRVLPGSRIQKTDVVMLSYDSLTLNNREIHSKYCPSSAGTYSSYKDLFEKLLSLNPRYININLDEHRGGYNRDSRCLKRGLHNSDVYADFINKLNDIIHLNQAVEVLPGVQIKGLGRPDVRLVMWDDMLNYWHNGGKEKGEYYQVRYGGQPGSTYLSLTGTPIKADPFAPKKKSTTQLAPDIILASWWYKDNDQFGIVANSPNFYAERGYDYIACPWDSSGNIRSWSKSVDGKKALGMVAATFGGKKDGIAPTVDYAWKSIRKRKPSN